MTAPAGFERRDPGPRVAVIVGTDHHPFNRLVSWTNDWLDAHPQQVPGFFVQSGAAEVVPDCLGSRYLGVGQLDAVLDQANVIVSHGGPATIAAAWARGMVPIAVPRLPQLGEHVDDHQVTFCLKLAELGRVWLAQTPAEFASKLAEATGDPARLRANVPAADVDAVVARFGELVEELVGRSRRRLPLWHRSPRVSHQLTTETLDVAVTMPPGLIPQPSTSRNARGGQVRAGLRELADEEQE